MRAATAFATSTEVLITARALLGIGDVAALRQAARDVMARALSVRDTEALVKKMAAPVPRPTAPAPASDVHTRAAEDRLRFALGTKVRILRRGSAGTIEISFGSESELNRLYELLVDVSRTHPST